MGAVTLRIFTSLVPILGVLVLAAGCHDSDPTRTATENAPQYSPFVVEVNGGDLLFEQITFKDVGMSVPPEHQTFVYETVAEALSARLGEDDEFAWRELATTGPDPVITVDPLARDIVADLAHAVSAGCLAKRC
jgi:hypothetical protein